MVVALVQPLKQGCVQPPHGGVHSSPPQGSDPPPSALDPSVNNADGYDIAGYMYARMHCARTTIIATTNAAHMRIDEFACFPARKLASESRDECEPEP